MIYNKKKPVFVPLECQDEMRKLSKDTLIDMVWDYAWLKVGNTATFSDKSHDALIDLVMGEFRHRREIILWYEKNPGLEENQHD